MAHLKVKCGKMLTSFSLPSQHQGHYCICIAVSLSISLSFSFTLWMVHLAYKTEWIHNPGQFKIPQGPVGIKMKPHKQKRLPHCHLKQPFIQLFPFNAVDKHSLPLTQKASLNKVYQLKTLSADLEEHHEELLHHLNNNSSSSWLSQQKVVFMTCTLFFSFHCEICF